MSTLTPAKEPQAGRLEEHVQKRRLASRVNSLSCRTGYMVPTKTTLFTDDT